MMKKLISEHLFSVVAPIEALIFGTFLFYLGKNLSFWRPHLDLTLPVDELVPFLPWTVSIYLATFLFWYFMLLLCSTEREPDRERVFCAYHLNAIVSFLFFVIMPTTNVRPELGGEGIWNWLMHVVYSADAPDNLFPSLHCSVAWLCWIGIRGRKDLPRWLSPAALIMAVAICLSTLTTRQHVMVDVFSGVALAELSWLAARSERLRAVYSRLIGAVMRFVQRLTRTAETAENGG